METIFEEQPQLCNINIKPEEHNLTECVEECLKNIEQKLDDTMSPLVKKELANKYFKDNNFTEAIVLYSELLLDDPLNYI